MKTNESSFQNYLVKDGQAVPENPFYYIMGSNVATDYSKFETWKQSHSYATDANDGSWTVERFEEPIWEFSLKGKNEWHQYSESPFHNFMYFKDKYSDEYDWRQFAKFKEEVEKLKGSENLLSLQSELRKHLFVRPFDINKIESIAIKLCDAIINNSEKPVYTNEEYLDLHGSKENAYLKARISSNEYFKLTEDKRRLYMRFCGRDEVYYTLNPAINI